jgi:hypothetical protein
MLDNFPEVADNALPLKMTGLHQGPQIGSFFARFQSAHRNGRWNDE